MFLRRRLNYVGTYLKAGPSTTQKPLPFHNGAAVVAPGSLYVADNVIEGNERVNQDNWRGLGYYYFERKSLEAPKPFPPPAGTTGPAPAAYNGGLKNAGAPLPQRDTVEH